MSTCAVCGAAVPDGARFCPACGAEQDATPQALEERKLATVLFADLVGSTARAGEEDPERVRVLQERFFEAMTEEIERTGGTVEKFAGDAVMAAFGAPAALEDHAERALHAALAMHRRLQDDFAGELTLRIGVATGEVVSGQGREASSFVTGDSVNVGARLEQAAAPGEVLAGERTVAAVRGAFEFGDLRVVDAKGKPGGIECRPVLRALGLTRPRGVGGLRRVFVGRESELELLRATFRRAVAQGEPHLVTIVGEPGVGKTRLVRELWDVLASERSAPLRRTGRCLPYGQGITYWPLREVLFEHFGIAESDAPEEVLRRLPGREILGLAIGLDAAGGVHPLDARERLHETTVALLEELAAERPLVLLVEDIHWAEDDLLDVLERVERDARAPVLLLTTSRPELLDRRPAWGGRRRNATTIWIEPLPDDATVQMLDELLVLDLPAELRELVVERAEGNPFFVEELVGSLVEAGVLTRGKEGWEAHEVPEGFSVPDSVHAVLAARIDRLPPTEKAALQAASVVGRLFWTSPVVHLLDGVEPDFGLLEERDFVRRRGGSSLPGEREYAIKHALTREVAYAGIPKARRGRLHAALGAWLEGSGLAKDEHSALLAHHYAQAVAPEDADLAWGDDPGELARLRTRALVWLERAAELAIGRYEIVEGVTLLRRALELEPERDVQVRLWRRIGMAASLRYDADVIVEGFERAIELTDDPDQLADLYSLLAFQTSVRSGMWRRRPPRDLIEGWTARALELASPRGVERTRALEARALHNPRENEEAALEASTLAEELGDLELRSWAWAALAACAFHRRRFDEALSWASRRFDVIEELADPDHTVEVYETLVPAVEALARYREGRRLAAAHRERSRTLSPHHRLHSAALAAEVEELAADWEALVRATPLVERAAEDNAETSCIRAPRSLLLCAVAAECVGDSERARELERIAARYEHEDYGFSLAHPRLRLALLREDRPALERLLEPQEPHRYSFGPGPIAATLDALAALRDRERIEIEAAGLLEQDGYLRPFAQRAVAIVHEDDALLDRAQASFEGLGLEWHAAQTARLVSSMR